MGTRKATFRWIKEAEAAFQRWKECMEILPTFTVPDHSEALFLHLATPSGEVSAVLLAKRRGIYIPIYSAKRTLQEIELSYTKAERLILTLVNAARCLRKYFQEHPIRVLTDNPIRRILSHPNKSTRIAKWALELGEYSIEYQKEDLAEGQAPTNVLSKSNQTVRVLRKSSIEQEGQIKYSPAVLRRPGYLRINLPQRAFDRAKTRMLQIFLFQKNQNLRRVKT
ncbi:reverse transcriptase domain-containing protein [Artemisia annua]|uniref:Reverse transcriptase domain-containing protein n=1 Tax=Artemisia annua TaxID=35608 RepID=A0A2U1Q9G3_ARTAN|nr:reverse transcriptase domain-containing protein [Artemisia annua]